MQIIPTVPPEARSDRLETTDVPAEDEEPRYWYLGHQEACEPIWISCSDFVSKEMVRHLMRDKKPSALGVKWMNGSDKITNMEGALHSFVTPLAFGFMHGDYQWAHGHDINSFAIVGGRQQARPVIFSGLVHLDFEYEKVMWDLVSSDDLRSLSSASDNLSAMMPISSDDIADKQARQNFEARLRTNTRLQLLKAYDVPRFVTSKDAAHNHITMKEASRLMAKAISESNVAAVLEAVYDKWICPSEFLSRSQRTQPRSLSLLLLFVCMLHQVRNEHSGLEIICPRTETRPGYVYSYNPPSIFLTSLGRDGPELMLHVYAAAMRYLSYMADYPSMRIFAYSDFDQPTAIGLLRKALARWDCVVVPKDEMFSGPDGNLYKPGERGERCILVVHNNSDGFGNNVETEHGKGSLDAIIGQYSNMATCLRQDGLALDTEERLMRWPSRDFRLS